MMSRLDCELEQTEGRFDKNYRVLVPGLSICYSDLQTAEFQIRRQIGSISNPDEQDFRVIVQIELEQG